MRVKWAKLAQWARPDYVVVSRGRHRPLTELRHRYGKNTRVLSTYDHGAITIEIDSDGRTDVVTCGSRQRAVHDYPPVVPVEDGEGTGILP